MSTNKGKMSLNSMVCVLTMALLCSVQSMAALTLSMLQVRHFEVGVKPDIPLYVLGFIILFLFMLAMIAIIPGRLIVSGICLLLCNIIALINYYEIQFHGTVLTCQDIRNISTAAGQIDNYSFRISGVVVLIIVSVFVTFISLVIVSFASQKKRVSVWLGVLSLSLLIILPGITVFSPLSSIRKDVWSWELKYYTDSFIVGTIENIKHVAHPVQKPDGYFEEVLGNMEGIFKEAKVENYPDIIMILNETYYDMDLIGDYKPDVPYMKNYDALEAYKGYAATPVTGGCTNASEYELLTGNSVTLLNTSTPFNDLSLENSLSIVQYLESLGYSTMAAHSEPPQNYHRKYGWETLGFDYTYFKEDFSNLEYYGDRWFASDSSVFSNFTHFYEQMPEDQPRFAFLLTIQNHGDWDRNSPAMDEVHIGNRNGLSDYDAERVNEFLTCIKQTDDCIEEMINYFSDSERDVLLFMVGDHGPSFLSNIEVDTREPIDIRKKQVPYFIWSNNDVDYRLDLPENHDIDLCSLTPCAMVAAGLPLSPYYLQLYEIADTAISISGVNYTKEDGSVSSGYVLKDGILKDVYEDTPESNLVRDYFYMEYNSLQGKPRMDALFDAVQKEAN